MGKKKNIICIVQARLDSKRFKNKIIKKFKDKTLIEILLNRLKKSELITKLIVAIPKKDKILKNLLKDKYNIFEGDEFDVLERYYLAAKKNKADIVVRVTGDCPLIDSQLIDAGLKKFLKSNFDYISNINPPTFPDGLDYEIFNFKTLERSHLKAKLKDDREHVTKYILKNNNFKKYNMTSIKDYSFLRITLDYKNDLNLIKFILKKFNHKKNFTYTDICMLYKKNKKTFNKNYNNFRNTQVNKITKGQKLWLEAKKIIAGGNMLFSKRPDCFLPEKWPSYFKSTNGCKVKDLDDNTYYDLCQMSVGTNSLGYSHPEVDREVAKVVKNGNMSTLNCPEEVLLAKKLLSLHPWAGKVRFARTGGEANALAVRLARASTPKKNIAFCGYHGWHDWYLAANLKSKNNLTQHLIKGLNVDGVPSNLKKTIFPFMYNEFDQLKKIVKDQNIGIIKMEVIRSDNPKNNFLKKIRKLADQNKIILIFDECTTGFRETLGGLHKKYKVNPDLLVLGKAMGNGYAITSVLGKDKIMNNIKNTFVSSTFWTERIGPAAALKTIEIMEKKKSWKIITSRGKYIIDNWKKIAKKNNLKIIIKGIPALCSFYFESKNNNAYKTYITQEMLKYGFLATNVVYLSTAHSKLIIDKYLKKMNIIFKEIREFEDGKDVYSYLETQLATESFSRLN
jgi:glutamate-1-semialdehyde 2,1-aminomutase